jgi:hypothetical protein
MLLDMLRPPLRAAPAGNAFAADVRDLLTPGAMRFLDPVHTFSHARRTGQPHITLRVLPR